MVFWSTGRRHRLAFERGFYRAIVAGDAVAPTAWLTLPFHRFVHRLFWHWTNFLTRVDVSETPTPEGTNFRLTFGTVNSSRFCQKSPISETVCCLPCPVNDWIYPDSTWLFPYVGVL